MCVLGGQKRDDVVIELYLAILCGCSCLVCEDSVLHPAGTAATGEEQDADGVKSDLVKSGLAVLSVWRTDV